MSASVPWGPHAAEIGATTTYLFGVMRSALRSLSKAPPDVVILYAGINDVFVSKIPIPVVVQNIRKLADQVLALNPKAKVLVAAPVGVWQWRKRLRKPGAPLVVEWRARLLSEHVAKAAWPAGVSVFNASAPYQGVGFSPERHTIDGVHPNEAGELLVAASAFDALRPILPAGRGGGGGENAAWLPALHLEVSAAEAAAEAEEKRRMA
eukprot:Hpha_TRINITY_DN23044_c0_g1::TRINITY_DN23044_c0_g1_i1::g.109416::m.109416